MADIKNGGLESTDGQDIEKDNKESLQENTGIVFGSFINDDQASDSSIGPGSSDEGIEPGEEDEEDEFRKDVTGSSPGAGFNNGTNEAGGLRGTSGGPIGNLAGKYDTNSSSAGDSGTMKKNKENKGLVEEGPGPDS
jgi:hypothetical protein